ncbi:MAG: DEAD/DEAH box helicase [Euryarchaeota archaeon]|nr:DEAD/DEAH box helicase [Euryarchaeota archaeon]
MKVDELATDQKLSARLKALGYDELWPTQERSIPLALEGKNLVLAVPTASGKSLVAYVALAHTALKGGRGVYIVPLRALASEKYDDLREFEELGIRVGMSIGDLDASDTRLADYDLLVLTAEKADALIRHRTGWLSNLKTIVVDEVHLLNDGDRGPTLEILMARLRRIAPKSQVIALSATIDNSDALAEWLDAEHVKSDWRPVPLREGVHFGRTITYADSASQEVVSDEDDPVTSLVTETLSGGGQALVFTNTRKSAESQAENLRLPVTKRLKKSELDALAIASEQIGASNAPGVVGKLARLVKGGVAFHHAGLSNDQRKVVERSFKAGLLKALTATPTLAAGVNLPARRVVIRDLWRYDSETGNRPIPVLEYKQMVGRAGRPRYDKFGEAISLAKGYDQMREIMETYVHASPERIRSKLAADAPLRTHILSLIAGNVTPSLKDLYAFIDTTFFAHESERWTIESRVESMIAFLQEEGLVEGDEDDYKATDFGRRTSELYIDPVSAVIMRDALRRAAGRETTSLSFLHAASRTPNMMRLYLGRGEDAWLHAAAIDRADELLFPLGRDSELEWFLSEVKTALLLEDWTQEIADDRMEEKYRVYPGDVHNKVETAVWLVYAMKELAHLFNPDARNALTGLEIRLKAGVKEELLPLIKLKHVARVRARVLYNAGFKRPQDLVTANEATLAKLPGIGKEIAASILKEVGARTQPTQTRLGVDPR